uniref:Uncharacterized protein n=1 Tax=Arundo donax TaxID=35708 RepID=A0A0A8YFG2_ARUDO
MARKHSVCKEQVAQVLENCSPYLA